MKNEAGELQSRIEAAEQEQLQIDRKAETILAKERELKWVKEAAEEAEEETLAAEETAKEAEGEEAEANAEAEAEAAGDAEAEAAEDAEVAEDGKLKEAAEKYQRLFAEFDNFRKRTEKEKAARYDMGARDVIEKVLPVLDSFELALKTIPEGEEKTPFAEGMEKIHKQFLKTLEDAGVTPIDAVGKEFDPNFHNAVLHVEDEEAGDNIVVEELQKGYLYKDHVVRYSMVKVAN